MHRLEVSQQGASWLKFSWVNLSRSPVRVPKSGLVPPLAYSELSPRRLRERLPLTTPTPRKNTEPNCVFIAVREEVLAWRRHKIAISGSDESLLPNLPPRPDDETYNPRGQYINLIINDDDHRVTKISWFFVRDHDTPVYRTSVGTENFPNDSSCLL